MPNCRLNPKSDYYVPAELDRANKGRAKYLALKAGRTSPTSVATPSPGKSAAATYTKAKSTRATAHADTTDPAAAFNEFLASLTPADRDPALPPSSAPTSSTPTRTPEGPAHADVHVPIILLLLLIYAMHL